MLFVGVDSYELFNTNSSSKYISTWRQGGHKVLPAMFNINNYLIQKQFFRKTYHGNTRSATVNPTEKYKGACYLP